MKKSLIIALVLLGCSKEYQSIKEQTFFLQVGETKRLNIKTDKSTLTSIKLDSIKDFRCSLKDCDLTYACTKRVYAYFHIQRSNSTALDSLKLGRAPCGTGDETTSNLNEFYTLNSGEVASVMGIKFGLVNITDQTYADPINYSVKLSIIP